MPAQPKKERTNQLNACRAKKTLIKNTSRTFNTNLSKLQARKKLRLELGGEMAIIMFNADKLEICPFVKFIWGQHLHIAFVAIIRLIH